MIHKLASYFNFLQNRKGKSGKIFKGVLWAFLGTMVSKGLLFLSFIIIAHYLTKEDYGKLGIIRSTIITLSLFSVASFGVTATKYLAIFVKENKAKAVRILSMTRVTVFILSFAISFLIFIFSTSIATNVFKDTSLIFAIQLSSIGVFFTAMNGLQTGILAGLEKFKYISFISISNGILSFIILLFSTIYFGLYGAIYALVCIQVLLWLESLFYLRKSFKEEGLSFKITNFREEFSIVKEFTIPSFIAGIIIPPVLYLCDLFIIDIPGGFAQLGIYKAAFNFSIITLTLNAVLGQVLYPFVMKNIKEQSRKLEFFNQAVPFLIGVLLNLPFILVPELFAKVFGSQYNTAAMHLSIVFISLSSIIIAQRQGISRNFASKNYMWWSFAGNLIWATVCIVCIYYLAKYGAIGISISLFIAYFLNTIIFIPFYISRKLIEKRDLFNKYTVCIWLIIFCSSVFIYIDIRLISKILLALLVMLIVSVISFRWLKEEFKFNI